MKGDVIGSLVLLVTGIGVVAGSLALRVGTPTDAQPGFFPFLGGVALVILSSALLVQACIGRSSGTNPFGELRRPAILLLGMAGYVALLEPIGYVLATILITGLILRVLNVKSWRTLGIGSVVLSVVSYLVFGRLLGIELPVGLLGALG